MTIRRRPEPAALRAGGPPSLVMDGFRRIDAWVARPFRILVVGIGVLMVGHLGALLTSSPQAGGLILVTELLAGGSYLAIEYLTGASGMVLVGVGAILAGSVAAGWWLSQLSVYPPLLSIGLVLAFGTVAYGLARLARVSSRPDPGSRGVPDE